MSATSRVSSTSMSAAATARLGSTERTVASVNREKVAELSFSAGVGNEEEYVRYDESYHSDSKENTPDEKQQNQNGGAAHAKVNNLDEVARKGHEVDETVIPLMLPDVEHALNAYEANIETVNNVENNEKREIIL
ncbi:MAG: hypothetical protein KAJ75_10135 [Alphaproteobacteria bacterium]|nr:hypothetical protein [Alphaproteobacteria bacterium]